MVADKWVDTHAPPPLADEPPPDLISKEHESARLQAPSFDTRQAMLEEGLAHLPSMVSF